MDLETFAATLRHRGEPASEDAIRALEARMGAPLPAGYRRFLALCNGGFAGGALSYRAADGTLYPVHHVGGLRAEPYFSLDATAAVYQGAQARIPRALRWIADDPFGNAYCLAVTGPRRGWVYFWDHEKEPEPTEWDGRVETAGNLTALVDGFEAFVGGLVPTRS